MKKGEKNASNVFARECMVSALMLLLEEKPLSSVSVTELTKKAGVSRMTYYRNYRSKDEIFITYLDDIVDSYRKDVASWEDKGNYNSYNNMLHCFQYFYKHKEFIKCLLRSGMGNLLLQALTDYVLETYWEDREDTAFYYTLHAFAGSLFNLYIAWILRSTADPAESMASVICKIYGNGDTGTEKTGVKEKAPIISD
ncbi:TetR/AcrR family transcriptional regulator [Lactonifactor longoviformis]|uniref:TetR/AcrR family transcriptional regulator n=1 Tax=Lactonifactor longoviformis TaxID=341220 RepID=UPI0036F42942